VHVDAPLLELGVDLDLLVLAEACGRGRGALVVVCVARDPVPAVEAAQRDSDEAPVGDVRRADSRTLRFREGVFDRAGLGALLAVLVLDRPRRRARVVALVAA